MYVYIQKSRSGDVAYLCENVWDKRKKAAKRRYTLRLGKVADLTANNPNAIVELREKYREEAKQELLKKAAPVLEGKPIRNGKLPLLNYGFFPLRTIWDELTLKYRVNYLKKTTTGIEFDVEKVLFNLVASRIISPSSNLKCWLDSSDKLGNPFVDVDLQHVYRTLDFMSKTSSELMRTIHKQLTTSHQRQCTCVFYDVTNAWFESPYTDAEKVEYEVNKHLAALPKEATQSEIDAVVEKINQKYPELLRMRGFSKEHRNDCPLVQVSLLVDSNHVPIDYRVYAGNCSEQTTLTEAVQSIREGYGIDESAIVADRGINNYDNVKETLKNGYGALMAQRLDLLPDDVQDKFLLKEDWKEIGKTGIKITEIDFEKCDSKRRKDNEPIPCRLVVTWSAKRAAHDLLKLRSDEIKARATLEKNETLENRGVRWRRLIKQVQKEKVTAKDCVIDEETLKQRKKLAGYYGIIYASADDCKRNLLSAEEIVDHYHRLTGIEDCFRVMKSNLELRPFYVRTPNHIRGAVGICVLALTLIRLLERKLREEKTPLSTKELLEGLNDALVAPFETKGGLCFQPLEGRKVASSEWKAGTKGKTRNIEPSIDLIMKAVKLRPITTAMTTPQLSKALRTRFANPKDLIPENKRKQVQEMAKRRAAKKK